MQQISNVVLLVTLHVYYQKVGHEHAISSIISPRVEVNVLSLIYTFFKELGLGLPTHQACPGVSRN